MTENLPETHEQKSPNPRWIIPHHGNVCCEGVQIDPEINPRGRKSVHAARVISCTIDMIHPNRIGTQLPHESCVSLTLRRVDQWIIFNQLIRNTLSHSISTYPAETRVSAYL